MILRKPDAGIWTRLKREDARAWKAFELYRDQRLPRSNAVAFRAYQAHYNNSLKANPSQSWQGWKKDNEWDKRCEAYDRNLAIMANSEDVDPVVEARMLILHRLPELVNAAIEIALDGDVKMLKDLMDRAGMVRANSKPGKRTIKAENAQFNVDFSGLKPDELAKLMDGLG